MKLLQVIRTETDPGDLEELLNKVRRFKQDEMQLLLKREYQRTQLEQRKMMLVNEADFDVSFDLGQVTTHFLGCWDTLDVGTGGMHEDTKGFLIPSSAASQVFGRSG